ncbi:hypothetical protein JHK87_032604 [Glycine soja]|nr:hypothetical protein JHK87_032604 [Glycine soja]
MNEPSKEQTRHNLCYAHYTPLNVGQFHIIEQALATETLAVPKHAKTPPKARQYGRPYYLRTSLGNMVLKNYHMNFEQTLAKRKAGQPQKHSEQLHVLRILPSPGFIKCNFHISITQQALD